jgi:hypothetical protein
MSRSLLGLVLVAVALLGCRTTRPSQSQSVPPPPSGPVTPTVLQYTDTDSFDVLFEASLINQAPAIIIRTDRDKPDWEGRLNAWIAAWNMGGKGDRRLIRGQIPISGANIDADFLREFRLLVFGVVDRAEDLAKAGSAWWREERTRSKRVELLRPYSLRFHMNEDMKIQLVFFHGNYAGQYADFMASLGAEKCDWKRSVECSMCTKLNDHAKTRPTLQFGE